MKVSSTISAEALSEVANALHALVDGSPSTPQCRAWVIHFLEADGVEDEIMMRALDFFGKDKESADFYISFSSSQCRKTFLSHKLSLTDPFID